MCRSKCNQFNPWPPGPHYVASVLQLAWTATPLVSTTRDTRSLVTLSLFEWASVSEAVELRSSAVERNFCLVPARARGEAILCQWLKKYHFGTCLGIGWAYILRNVALEKEHREKGHQRHCQLLQRYILTVCITAHGSLWRAEGSEARSSSFRETTVPPHTPHMIRASSNPNSLL